MTFARNRSEFITKRISGRSSKRKSSVNYTHNPEINKRSRYIVKNLHSKLNEHKIPHYELLLYKGKEYDKKKEINIQNEMTKAPESCTFVPNINKTTIKNIRDKSQLKHERQLSHNSEVSKILKSYKNFYSHR